MIHEPSQSQHSGEIPALDSLRLWLDPLPRTGYENMAADELLSRHDSAWLRVYGWSQPSVSYGYFDTRAVAAALFPGEELHYIRRWTGGGIVDHRLGYTYTITLPSRAELYPNSAILYQWIHGALAEALSRSGVACRLLESDAPDGGRACWASPVASDIVDAEGRKLAGAGQRRYRGAVLHQGLIQQCSPLPGWQQLLAAALSPHVITIQEEEPWPGFTRELKQLCHEKYLHPLWEDESHGRRKITTS